MSDARRRSATAAAWAAGGASASIAALGEAPEGVRQRSVRLLPATAALLRAEARRSGRSNGEIIASALDPLTLTLAARDVAASQRRQVTFTLGDEQVESLDAAASAAGCTRSELLDRLLAIKFGAAV